MSLLIEPLAKTMKRLSFAVKFSLVAVVFIFPLVVTSALLLIKLERELHITQLEQRGAEYASGLSRLLSALQQARAAQSA